MRCDCLNAARIGAQQPGNRRNTTRQFLTREMQAPPSENSANFLRDALDDRDTRLRNVAHPYAPARGPWRSPATASTPASSRAPVEAPTGKVVWGSHIIAGAVGRDRSAASGATSPRAGAAEGRAGAAEGQRAAIAAPLDEANSAIDATRRRAAQNATGQPQHSEDTAQTRAPREQARSTRWPAATRRRAAPV